MAFGKLLDKGRATATALRDVLLRGPTAEPARESVVRPAAPAEPPPHYQPPVEFPRPPPRAHKPYVAADDRAIGYVDDRPGAVAASRVIALYASTVPWREVSRALPQFDGHAQPRLPGELGFYAPGAVLRRQVELARAYGVGAFCFECGDVADRFVADAALDLQFCVRDDGKGSSEPYLRDARYVRVEGRPLVVAANGADAARLRERLGDVFLVGMGDPDARDHGFDASLVDPHAAVGPAPITARQLLINAHFRGRVFDWREFDARPGVDGVIPIVNVGRDDEPTAPGAGTVFHHASPRRFGERLSRALRATTGHVFVDAWNDWGRGAALEPDARLGYAYLAATRAAVSGATKQSKPVAVVHVYYIELLDEIVAALRAAGVELRLIVTTPADREPLVRRRLSELGVEAEVEAHENRGRDILPFLRVANRLLDEGVDVVLKLHTKHSGHRTDGDDWRAQLIGRLVEPSRARKIVDAFAQDPQLGCVAPEGHVLPLSVYWGWNEETVRYLCVRMGIRDPDIANDRFAAGSMFWMRLSALRPLLDAHLGEWEFEPEGGYVDGTMAHAIERALTLAVQGAGFRAATAADVCGIAFTADDAYAFAQKSHPG